jgi:hypothetical protein
VTFLWRALSLSSFSGSLQLQFVKGKKKGLMVFLFEKKEEPLQDVPSAVVTGVDRRKTVIEAMDGALSMESAEAAKEESAVDSPDPSLSLCDHNKKSILYASKASDVRCFRLQSKKITEDFILHIGNIGIPSAKLFRELDIILPLPDNCMQRLPGTPYLKLSLSLSLSLSS